MTGARYAPGERITAGSLYRRIPNKKDYFVFDANPPRPGGLTFLPDGGEPYTSTSLTEMTTPEKVLEGHPGYGLCEALIEQLPAGVTATYEPQDGEEDHVAVWGLGRDATAGGKNEGERRRRAIALSAKVIRTPDRPTARPVAPA